AIQGQLASAGDADRYRIQAAESGSMTVVLDVPTNNTSQNFFVLQVYDASRTQLAQYRTGQDRTVTVGVPQAGAYDIVIQAEGYNSYDGNAYKLTATLAAGGAQGYESEANESATAADADPLNLGGLTRGQLASSGDTDYYQVTVNAKGILTVELDVPTNSTTNKPYRLRLFDTNGRTQLFDNNYGTGQDSTYTLELPKAGTYFLELSSYYSSALKDDTYALKSSFSAGATGGKELEINDSKAQADPISSGVKVSGGLSGYSDKDYYRLDVGAAGVLSVLLDVPASLSASDYRYQYFSLGVYDAQDKLLGVYSTSVDKTYQFGLPAAGSYYLIVGSPYYHSSDTYSITATHSVGSTAGFESEGNDSAQAPNSLSSGVAIQGQLASAGDADRYRIQAAESGSMTVVLDVPT
ncbi:MAG: hypothetical protein EBT04_15860, partial [Betaproteobacteria bacterium]|nr:hypothetical protein [Betaproteobacteria bacterium]